MSISNNLKMIALSTTIALGLIVQGTSAKAAGTETLLVAGGCFWCVESDFESVKGVKEVISGFAGGTTKNPTYKQVVAGGTGHYEAAQIQYDPAVVSADQLLAMFFRCWWPILRPWRHLSHSDLCQWRSAKGCSRKSQSRCASRIGQGRCYTYFRQDDILSCRCVSPGLLQKR